MAPRPSIMDFHAYTHEDGALVGLISKLAAGEQIERAEISCAAAAGRISRSAEMALHTAADRWPGDSSSDAVADAFQDARTVVAAYADGHLWLSEALEQLLAMAAAGQLGTGSQRRNVLRETMASLRAVHDVMRERILAPEGKAARKIIADHFRRAAGGPQPQLASFERLALRRQLVQVVARWAELIALAGMDPEQAARAAIAEAGGAR